MRFLFSISIVISFLCSCDGPYENCPAMRFSQEFKSYTMFTPGSYWVYEDSLGNIIDSIILKRQVMPFYSECDYNSTPQENLIQEFYSSFLSNDSGYIKAYGYPDWEEYSISKNNALGYYINKAQPGEIGGFQKEMKYEQFLDSLNIKDVWYKNIKIISATSNPMIKFYWAKNVGIIKKTISRSLNSDSLYNLELVRYKLK